MNAIDLDDTEQPIDPKLVLAIEAAFRSVSLTKVQFVPTPRAWRHPQGSVTGPKGDAKGRIKLELVKRDGPRCAYCTREFVDLDDATLDHVIPNCVVRHWQPWNLLLACDACNNLKADNVPLILVPMLCHLLAKMAQVIAYQRTQPTDPIPTNGFPSKKAARRAAKAAQRRNRINLHIEALAGHPVRLAIEAAPVRAALTAGEDGTR